MATGSIASIFQLFLDGIDCSERSFSFVLPLDQFHIVLLPPDLKLHLLNFCRRVESEEFQSLRISGTSIFVFSVDVMLIAKTIITISSDFDVESIFASTQVLFSPHLKCSIPYNVALMKTPLVFRVEESVACVSIFKSQLNRPSTPDTPISTKSEVRHLKIDRDAHVTGRRHHKKAQDMILQKLSHGSREK